MLRRLFKKKHKEKRIPDNTYRVIKISKEALFEFIYESFIDNQKVFLNISDETSVVTSYNMDWDEKTFIIVAQNANEKMPFYNDIDMQKISKAISDTVSTMYGDRRYIDLTEKQIEDMQNA